MSDTNTRAELADERVGLVARAIEREAEECGFSIFSDDAESIARAVLSALRGQGEGPLGPEQRCPSCGSRFQKVHDVDAHLGSLPAPPSQAGDDDGR